MLSGVPLFATPYTVASQAPLCIVFPRHTGNSSRQILDCHSHQGITSKDMQMLNRAGEFVLLTFALKYFNLEETKEEKKMILLSGKMLIPARLTEEEHPG